MKLKQLAISFIVILTILSCDKEVSVTIHEEDKYETCSIFIDTNPKGSIIYVDGKNSSYKSPDTVKWLSEGNHLFSLKTDLFVDHKFEITVNNEDTENYFYDYLKDPKNLGTLKVSSSPEGSIIFLEDSLLTNSLTPHTIDSLLPGDYKVKLSFPEHRSDSAIVRIYGSKNSEYFAKLIDTSLIVNYNKENSSIANNTIYDIYVDDNNIKWLSTRNGIVKLSGNNWENLNISNSPLSHDVVHKIRQDKSGTYWIATVNGLNKIENGIWTTYTSTNSPLPGDYITDFDFDIEGNIWITTDLGFAKLANGEWTIYNNYNSGLQSNFTKAIAVSKLNNHIWLGTRGSGIVRFDGINQWKYYIKTPGIISLEKRSNSYQDSIEVSDIHVMGNSISSIVIDEFQNIWIGYSEKVLKDEIIVPGGVQVLSSDSIRTIDFGFETQIVNSLYCAKNNQIIVSSNKGMCTITNQTYPKVYPSFKSGIPSYDIQSVFESTNGVLWIGTGNVGLVKFKNFF